MIEDDGSKRIRVCKACEIGVDNYTCSVGDISKCEVEVCAFCSLCVCDNCKNLTSTSFPLELVPIHLWVCSRSKNVDKCVIFDHENEDQSTVNSQNMVEGDGFSENVDGCAIFDNENEDQPTVNAE